MLVREAQLFDAAELNALNVELGHNTTVQETIGQLTALLSDSQHQLLVLEIDGMVVAFLHAFKTLRLNTTPFVEIGGLAVLKAFQKQGIATQLNQHLLANWANDYPVRVRCNTKRLNAHRLYQKCGFDELKEQKVFLYSNAKKT